MKYNTIEVSQKFSIRLSTVFYHINYCHSSVHITFRLTYETSKSTVRYMLKVIVRDTTKSLLKQL